MTNETIRVYFMGTQIGYASGWDEADEFALQFYDFVPTPEMHNDAMLNKIEACECLVLNPFANPQQYVGQNKGKIIVAFSLTKAGRIDKVFV